MSPVKKITHSNSLMLNIRYALRLIISNSVYDTISDLRSKISRLEKINYKISLGLPNESKTKRNEEKTKILYTQMHELEAALKQSICSCYSCNNKTRNMVLIPKSESPFFSPNDSWYCTKCADYVLSHDLHLKYEINNFISLEFDDYFTWVIIKKKRIKSCAKIVFEIPYSDNELKENIHKIDNIDEFLELKEEVYKNMITKSNREWRPFIGSDYKEDFIPYSVQFWAHCSNIEAWVQSGYDTRILHSNIAFPLLKELFSAGDLKAKQVFKEEIAKRYTNGNGNVRLFLKSQGYLKYLNDEEISLLNSI